MQAVRTVLFYFLMCLSVVLWCPICLVVGSLLPLHVRCLFCAPLWCRFAVWLARVILGMRYEVEGLENIPKQPCVVLSKHQSTWETFYLTGLFAPLALVLKRELLRIPFFGWALALVKPIAIDRSNPKQALKQVSKLGHERLGEGFWLLIFPEGTRVPAGQMGKFSRSGAALAVGAGRPVLPVALNAGECWPRDSWKRYPGTIRVVIGAPMYAEGDGPTAIAELNQRAEQWVTQTMQRIDGTARAK